MRTSLARRSLIAITTIAMVAVVGPDVFNDGGTFTVDGTPVPVG